MRSSLLALLLLPGLALAEPGAVNLYQPKEPEMVGYPNWVLTPRGHQLWSEDLARGHAEAVRLRAENESLVKGMKELEHRPLLTWRGALILVGVGVLVGASVSIPVALAARR